MTRLHATGPIWIVVALALGGCSEAGPRIPPQEPPAEQGRVLDEEKNMLYVPQEDSGMNAAIARARASVPEFLPRLQHPPSGQSYVGVKVRLGEEGEEGEHIWLSDVRLQDGRIVGRLVDDAVYFPQWKRGAEVRVAPAEISDWMTVENGRACGGFTTRVVVRQMEPDARAAFLRDMGVERMPEGDAVCDDDARG